MCVCVGVRGGGGILDCQTPCMGLKAAQFPSSLGTVPLKTLITTSAQHPFHVRYIFYTGHSIGVGWWVGGGVSVGGGKGVCACHASCQMQFLFTVIIHSSHLTAIKFIVYISKWKV